MRIRTLRNNHGFLGLLELLAVLAIIGILAYFMLKRFTAGPVMDKNTQQTMSEQGIDTTTYRSVVDTTRSTLNDMTAKQQQQLDQITKEGTREE
jgi:type II secretory pathway pseudopilin PulG